MKENLPMDLSSSVLFDLLGLIAGSVDAEDRRRVALCPLTPRDILRSFQNDEDVNVKIAVIQNSSTDDSLLELYANDNDERVVREILANPRTNSASLKIICAKWDSDEILLKIANHPCVGIGSLIEVFEKGSNRAKAIVSPLIMDKLEKSHSLGRWLRDNTR